MRKDRADLKTAWIRAHRRSNCALRRVCARTRARVCVRVRVRVYVWVWVCVSGPSGAGNARCARRGGSDTLGTRRRRVPGRRLPVIL
jgi:hypothetical protein